MTEEPVLRVSNVLMNDLREFRVKHPEVTWMLYSTGDDFGVKVSLSSRSAILSGSDAGGTLVFIGLHSARALRAYEVSVGDAFDTARNWLMYGQLGGTTNGS